MRCKGENYRNNASKTLQEVKRDAWIVNIMASDDKSLKDPHQVAFIVSKTRTFEDYKNVVRHNKRSKRVGLELTPYSENLLASCFKGW